MHICISLTHNPTKLHLGKISMSIFQYILFQNDSLMCITRKMFLYDIFLKVQKSIFSKYTIFSLPFCTPSKQENLFTFLFTCHFTFSIAFRDFDCTKNSKFVPNIISHAHYSCLSTALPVINSTNSRVIHFQKAHKPKSSQKTESTPWCSIVSNVDYFQQLEYFGFGILGSEFRPVAGYSLFGQNSQTFL